MVATVALEMSGPTPGTVISLWQGVSLCASTTETCAYIPGLSIAPVFSSVARRVSMRVASLTRGSIAVIWALKVLPGTASMERSTF